MNKNKLRWILYKILVIKCKKLRPRRGGYSLEFLAAYLLNNHNLELGLYAMNPSLVTYLNAYFGDC